MRFVDTRVAVAGVGDPDLLASSPDGLHPDVAGYRKMADAIGMAIEGATETVAWSFTPSSARRARSRSAAQHGDPARTPRSTE